MTWKRKELVRQGRLNPPMGMCPACSADLVPMLLTNGKYAIYVCSRKGCTYEKRGVPRSSNPYGGPGKGPKG